jgi:hypothetical protein
MSSAFSTLNALDRLMPHFLSEPSVLGRVLDGVRESCSVVRRGSRPVRSAKSPLRGVCDCGHVMSMHCASDGSGPCAATDRSPPEATVSRPRNRHKMWVDRPAHPR